MKNFLLISLIVLSPFIIGGIVDLVAKSLMKLYIYLKKKNCSKDIVELSVAIIVLIIGFTISYVFESFFINCIVSFFAAVLFVHIAMRIAFHFAVVRNSRLINVLVLASTIYGGYLTYNYTIGICGEDEGMVYVTRYGECYHKDKKCYHIQGKVISRKNLIYCNRRPCADCCNE